MNELGLEPTMKHMQVRSAAMAMLAKGVVHPLSSNGTGPLAGTAHTHPITFSSLGTLQWRSSKQHGFKNKPASALGTLQCR